MAPRRHAPGGPRPAEFDLHAASATLGVVLSANQEASLLRFVEILSRWNGVYNLTAVRDPAQMRTHHLFDCLAVVAPLRRQLGDASGSRLLDVGSGGGLPGVVLAITDPDMQVCCVDAVGKKAAFVRQAAVELGLHNLTSLHARIEDVTGPTFDVITSRAYAALPGFVQSSGHVLAPGGVWMAMKGRPPTEEIAALPADVVSFHVEQLKVPGLEAERCLVWLKR